MINVVGSSVSVCKTAVGVCVSRWLSVAVVYLSHWGIQKWNADRFWALLTCFITLYGESLKSGLWA